MRIMGIALASCLAVAGMFALAPPAETDANPPGVLAIDTEQIAPDSLMVAFDLLRIEDEPVIALVGKPAEPVPLPPRQIGQPFGIVPTPADRYLC